MHCLIFAYSWKIVPFVVIINFAALRTIPVELIESAQIDGAGWFKQLWHVRLPLILPALAVALLFCVIFSMRAFDLVYLLTKGGPGEATAVLSYYTYATTFEFGDVGAGAAVSIMLAGVTLVATVIYWYLLQRLEHDQ
jgi:multiple sugar transport system permease protein